jgi:hypothetical protein
MVPHDPEDCCNRATGQVVSLVVCIESKTEILLQGLCVDDVWSNCGTPQAMGGEKQTERPTSSHRSEMISLIFR